MIFNLFGYYYFFTDRFSIAFSQEDEYAAFYERYPLGKVVGIIQFHLLHQYAQFIQEIERAFLIGFNYQCAIARVREDP